MCIRDSCKDECNFAEDAYISVDLAISQVRDEVPGLIDVMRERVDKISQTRSELDKLLGRVEQEKVTLTYLEQCVGSYMTLCSCVSALYMS